MGVKQSIAIAKLLNEVLPEEVEDPPAAPPLRTMMNNGCQKPTPLWLTANR